MEKLPDECPTLFARQPDAMHLRPQVQRPREPAAANGIGGKNRTAGAHADCPGRSCQWAISLDRANGELPAHGKRASNSQGPLYLGVLFQIHWHVCWLDKVVWRNA